MSLRCGLRSHQVDRQPEGPGTVTTLRHADTLPAPRPFTAPLRPRHAATDHRGAAGAVTFRPLVAGPRQLTRRQEGGLGPSVPRARRERSGCQAMSSAH